MRSGYPPFSESGEALSSDLPTRDFSEILLSELQQRSAAGEELRLDDYLDKYREFESEVRRVFSEWEACHHSRDSCNRSADSTAASPSPGSTTSPAATESLVGKFLGRYRIDQFLGRGGFGEVWKGFDPELSRVVAVKVARRDRAHSQTALDRFVEEARKAASLSHSGIVQVYDIAKIDEGYVIVSEFIDGESLSTRLKQGPIPLGTAVSIVIDIARGLQHAHVRDLIHRDVKPGNILLRSAGGAVLTDFGLAVREQDLVAEPNVVSGTIRYMSPEQARGESANLDHRTDIFSLGLVLFHMVTGRLPYPESDTKSYLRTVASRPPRPIRSITELAPPDLEKICMKALAFSAEDRYATCLEFAEALDEWRGRCTESESTRVLVPPPARRWLRPWMIGLLAGGGLVLSLVIVQLKRYTPPPANAIPLAQGVPQPVPLPPAQDVRPAAGVVSPEGWVSLLVQEPQLVAWESSEGRSAPRFDANLRQFSARSERSRWLFQCAEQDSQPFQMRTAIRVQDWLGYAGIVWGLQEDQTHFPEQWFRGLSLEFTRHDLTEPSTLVARQIRLKRQDFDEIRIQSGRQIAVLEIPTPVHEEAVLEIDVRQNELIVRFDGGQVWRPVDILQETDWLPDGRAAVGIIGQGVNVEFKSLSIHMQPSP